MTITSAVQSQFFLDQRHLIRLPANDASRTVVAKRKSGTTWSPDEHNRFLEALERYPSGPWKYIAAYVQTRTTRQTMTHAQKYREKIARHSRAQEPLEATLAATSTKCYSITQRGSPQLGSPQHSVTDTQYGSPQSVYDVAGHLDDKCIDSAITSLLDDYEPFDLLSTDDFSVAFWSTTRSDGDLLHTSL